MERRWEKSWDSFVVVFDYRDCFSLYPAEFPSPYRISCWLCLFRSDNMVLYRYDNLVLFCGNVGEDVRVIVIQNTNIRTLLTLEVDYFLIAQFVFLSTFAFNTEFLHTCGGNTNLLLIPTIKN